ncbi:hypothetical protein BDV93DRAFT_508601 [Ceratobasidium sp. AG-I]|nr:hypothetical protein BDV93DRAFT_508601 [Ceratobasidium sp. AG-I]
MRPTFFTTLESHQTLVAATASLGNLQLVSHSQVTVNPTCADHPSPKIRNTDVDNPTKCTRIVIIYRGVHTLKPTYPQFPLGFPFPADSPKPNAMHIANFILSGKW